jgi:lytic murein transglycosylase
LFIALCFSWVVAPGAVLAADFRSFLRDLRPDALAAGVSAATFDRETATLAPDLTLTDLVLPGRTRAQGTQAEFSRTPGQYLDPKLLADLTARGRALAATHAGALARIETAYGVDPHTLLAIWGRETSFGTYPLPHDAIRALASQAWLGRRKALFRDELIAALRLVDRGILTGHRRKSSWAGAIGLVQFMPSEFDTLGQDGDGDGKIDLWGSVPDALASAAKQLQAKGWTAGQPWGFEVRLPADARQACLAEGPGQAKPLADWIATGYAPADGRRLDGALARMPVFLLAPGGTHGPMFLVFENFLVLKAYNFADLYAVFVGHLGDRLAGRSGFATPWRTPPILANADIEVVQQRLREAGLPVEKIDGRAGMNTRSLIGRWQIDIGLAADCWPSAALLAAMRERAR